MSFEKANEYASKFEPFREFYQENDNLDIISLQEEDHGTLAHTVQYNMPSGRGYSVAVVCVVQGVHSVAVVCVVQGVHSVAVVCVVQGVHSVAVVCVVQGVHSVAVVCVVQGVHSVAVVCSARGALGGSCV